MLLMSGRGAGAAAGGGITVIVAAVLSIFGGGDEETPQPSAEHQPATEQEASDENGATQAPQTPAGHEMSNVAVVDGGSDSTEPDDTPGEASPPADVDPLAVPKLSFADLLQALDALANIEQPTHEQIRAVFAGDLLLVPQMEARDWSIFRAKLSSLVHSERLPRTGPNDTDFGPLHIHRTAEGEWRIHLE